MSPKRRIGIVGFGHLGQYLAEKVAEHPDLELAFVWNRSPEVFSGRVHDPDLILTDLKDFAIRKPDLIVEVAHPSITHDFGSQFLQCADYLIGSPTALTNAATERLVKESANLHGAYVPSGALWGAADIRKMADSNSLKSLRVTMRKHPDSFKLGSELAALNNVARMEGRPVVLYDGPVRGIGALAPNNTNSIAAAAVAGYTLGFDQVQACLVADTSLASCHVIEVEVHGNAGFHTETQRVNPAAVGAVTGQATFGAIFSSLLSAVSKGPGIHLC